jgi:hypothetical protein
MGDIKMLYSMSNPDWESRGKFKGGFTTDPPKRLYDGHPYHSALSKYKNLYKIIEIDPDKLKKLPFINQPDRIIFANGLEKRTKELKRNYSCKLVNLELIKPYLISDGGGTEFIKNEGIDIFDKIITEDFPKLGYNIQKLTEEEVNCYNELQYKYIKKNKQENEIEEQKVMVRLNKQYKKQKNKRKKELQKLKEQDLEKYIRIKLGQIPFKGKSYPPVEPLFFGGGVGHNDVDVLNSNFDEDLKGYKVLIPFHKGIVLPKLLKNIDYENHNYEESPSYSSIDFPYGIFNVDLNPKKEDEPYREVECGEPESYNIMRGIIDNINNNVKNCVKCGQMKYCKKGCCNKCYGKYYKCGNKLTYVNANISIEYPYDNSFNWYT